MSKLNSIIVPLEEIDRHAGRRSLFEDNASAGSWQLALQVFASHTGAGRHRVVTCFNTVDP